MNREGHLTVGVLLFIPYFLLLNLVRTFSTDILIFSIIAVAITSILPDIIEPANDWKHRGYAHSKRLFKRLILLFIITTLVSLLLPYILIISSASLGYSTHLIADSTTKVGLPY